MGKKSKNTSTQSTVYGNTTTSNPYATSRTNNSGTVASFQPGTALDSIYNYVNQNINSVLNDYLNPSLNSTTNQAKLNAFTKTLNNESHKNLENNIINPLSNRNLLRSSQASDLYRNLSNQNTESLSEYIDHLLADSQNQTASVMNNLLSAYMNGYDVLSNMQNHSLQASSGNATHIGTTKNTTSGVSADQILRAAQLIANFMLLSNSNGASAESK